MPDPNPGLSLPLNEVVPLLQNANLALADAADRLPAILDGTQFTYLHLTRAGGRRVFMNNPGVGIRRKDDGEEDVYARLVGVFRDLASSTER